MNRTSVLALAGALLLTATGPGRAQEPAPPTAPLAAVLGVEGVDRTVLSTVFRFAADFNDRPEKERQGARIVAVQEDFPPVIAQAAHGTHGPPDPERARSALRARVTRFLDNYVAFLAGRSDVRRDAIVLRRSETIDIYLSHARQRGDCNQIPCPRPPCCKDCSAPAGEPPACPAAPQ
jgi:hypothetical protein